MREKKRDDTGHRPDEGKDGRRVTVGYHVFQVELPCDNLD